MTAAQLFTIFAGFIGVVALGIYIFGIPPELKRKLERQALKTMGENKMSYLAKDQINKIPDSDQKDIGNLKKGLGNAVGGVTQNPLGEATGRAASQVWDSMQVYSKNAFERMSTMTTATMEAAMRKATG